MRALLSTLRRFSRVSHRWHAEGLGALQIDRAEHYRTVLTEIAADRVVSTMSPHDLPEGVRAIIEARARR